MADGLNINWNTVPYEETQVFPDDDFGALNISKLGTGSSNSSSWGLNDIMGWGGLATKGLSALGGLYNAFINTPQQISAMEDYYNGILARKDAERRYNAELNKQSYLTAYNAAGALGNGEVYTDSNGNRSWGRGGSNSATVQAHNKAYNALASKLDNAVRV